MLTTFQIRAARAGLNLNADELALAAKINRNTILKLEGRKDNSSPDKTPSALTDTVRKLQDYYESAGVEFLPDNGVRFIGKIKNNK